MATAQQKPLIKSYSDTDENPFLSADMQGSPFPYSYIASCKKKINKLNSQVMEKPEVSEIVVKYEHLMMEVIENQGNDSDESIELLEKVVSDLNDIATRLMSVKKMKSATQLLKVGMRIMDLFKDSFDPRLLINTQNNMGFCITESSKNMPSEKDMNNA